MSKTLAKALPHKTWDTHEAKDKFSQVLAEAQKEEQVILRYGKPFAVIISYDTYSKGSDSKGSEQSAWDALRPAEPIDEPLELPPRTETMRDIEL